MQKDYNFFINWFRILLILSMNFGQCIIIRNHIAYIQRFFFIFWSFDSYLKQRPVKILNLFTLLTVCYFVVNLYNTFDAWLLAAISIEGIAWMASSYGLVLSTLFKDASVVMALVPALIIPLLLVGGFFAPLNQVHDFYRLFEYISMFKYGYQTMV